MEIRVWSFQNYRDCRYTCNPHKFKIPALRFPCRVPAIPCKHLQCSFHFQFFLSVHSDVAFPEKQELDNSWNQLPLQTDFPSNSIRPIAKNLKDRFYTTYMDGAQIKTLLRVHHLTCRPLIVIVFFLPPISWEIRILGIVSCFLREYLGFSSDFLERKNSWYRVIFFHDFLFFCQSSL